MIISIGVDIVNITRIEKIIDKYQDKFIRRVFAEREILLSKKYINQDKLSAFYAKRFAAKEAFAKAVGTGIGNVLSFKEIEVLNDASGKPYIRLYNIKKIENKLNVKKVKIDVSLSDDYPNAIAFVVLSRACRQNTLFL